MMILEKYNYDFPGWKISFQKQQFQPGFEAHLDKIFMRKVWGVMVWNKTIQSD
jgi:hypothetical protein